MRELCVAEFKFFSFRSKFIYNKMHTFKCVMEPLTTVYTYVIDMLRYKTFKSFHKVPCALLQSICCLLGKKQLFWFLAKSFLPNIFFQRLVVTVISGFTFWRGRIWLAEVSLCIGNLYVDVQSSVTRAGSDRKRLGHEGSWTDHPDVSALNLAKNC